MLKGLNLISLSKVYCFSLPYWPNFRNAIRAVWRVRRIDKHFFATFPQKSWIILSKISKHDSVHLFGSQILLLAQQTFELFFDQKVSFHCESSNPKVWPLRKVFFHIRYALLVPNTWHSSSVPKIKKGKQTQMYPNAETLSIFIVPKERLECDFRGFFLINNLNVNLCTTENLEHYQK